MSVSGQAGCATTIGIALALAGIGIVAALQNDEAGAGEGTWVIYAVGIGFGTIGLLVAVLGLKMFLMKRIPETILEVDRMPVRADQPFHVTVRQPGPVRLKSLRVNLVCEQTTVRPGKKRRNRDQRIVHLTNVVNLGETTAGPGEQVVGDATVTVPADVKYADIIGQREIVWRLEVWGRVRGWVDFGHPYVIEVHPADEPRAPPPGPTR
jgi:hypothetical protein